ncbi:hypothetical protein Prudu_020757 [Prunus dulcis]|uniref:Patatin n=1 Tax=Prunus dulcis TaxID=3755 RepID=A0A4Y1RXE6_PRUDU|nr:hypothetical protein Prudu_020757 [Prunus dulcis]
MYLSLSRDFAQQPTLARFDVATAITLGTDLRRGYRWNRDSTAVLFRPNQPRGAGIWPENHDFRRWFARLPPELPAQISPSFLHQIDRAPGARQDFKRRPLRDRSSSDHLFYFLYAAKDIVSFYRQHCPKIFPQPSSSRIGKIIHYLKCLVRPKYTGKYLHMLLKKILGDKHLHDMLTNVAITTTDMKQELYLPYMLVMILMSDICVGTSAAPAYLPPHQFTTTTSTGESREFNLIDGGIAANNPAMVGIIESEIHMQEGNTGIHERILLISLGTGTTSEKKYDAKKAACWGALDWLIGKDRSAPLVDLLMRVNSVMVEYESGSFFKTLRSNGNYLRIQDDTLSGTLAFVDIATEENLNDLVKVGEALLKKHVSRLNLDTGELEPVHPEVTNEVALERMAKILSEERARRKRVEFVCTDKAL